MADRPAQPEAGPTAKQQRDARRAEKVTAMKRQQERSRRRRIAAIAGGSVAAVAVVALVVVLVVANSAPTTTPPAAVDGERTWSDLPSNHVGGTVDYEAEYGMTPPAGGDHAAAWLNCGVYDQQVPNENAVHSLEHGAVWATYDPDALDADEIDRLRGSVPSTYSIVSPFDGLPSPVVISAWGSQLQLEGVDQERIAAFVEKHWQSPDAPEPGAACTGALDGPGKIS